MTTIPSLAGTDTFDTWFNTTNTIITTINGISMYRGFSGDGVNVTFDSSGNYTFSHSNNVNTGVTFNGNITFNGSVAFGSGGPSITTTTINITPKITGLTSGNIVIISPTLGLTLAKADSAVNAEVFGIVVNQTATSTVVAVGGSVNNDLFSKTIGNALGISGATLTPGQAYFLSPTVSGGITTTEPNTYGQVSKPVLLGITGNSGLFLPYRGVLLEGISAGITAELDNKVIIELDYSTLPAGYTSGASVKVGDPVCYYSDNIEGIGSIDIAKLSYKAVGTINNSTRNVGFVPDVNIQTTSLSSVIESSFLGLVSKIISNASSKYILEVTTPGGSFNATISDLDTNFYKDTSITGSRFADTDVNTSKVGLTFGNSYVHKFLDYIYVDATTAKIILNKTQNSIVRAALLAAVAPGGETLGTEYDNLIPNGAFSVWQRNVTGLTAINLNNYSTPFADRWFVVKSPLANAAGLTASVTRQTFSSTQTDVPGSPLYYIDCNFRFVGSIEYGTPAIENIQKEARLLQGQDATISFWAKSTSTTSVNLFYNRYRDNYSLGGITGDVSNRDSIAGVTIIGGVWQEYKQTFSVDPWTDAFGGFSLGSPSDVGWFGVGFQFPSSTETISLAQVQLDFAGSEGPVFYVSPETELERCKPYYQRTYDLGQTAGNDYSGSASTLNEYTIQTSNLSTQKTYFVKFPTKMVASPTVILYTPNGVLGDALNVNAGVNMINSSTGALVTYPWSSTPFYRTASSSQYGNIAVSNSSKTGMEISIIDGALSLDALKFHYIANSDLDLNV